MPKEFRNLDISYTSYTTDAELDSDDLELLNAAKSAAKTAYAPYSGFKVGAAVRLESGVILTGSNQENAAYPSGLCAERTVLFHAGSAYPNDAIKAMAITGIGNEPVEEPVFPCGACRQVMLENYSRTGDFHVIMAGETGEVIVVDTPRVLVPFAFLQIPK